MSLQLSFAQASAIGPREENQDALRLVTPAPTLAASKGYLFAIADGVSQCADGGLAARSTLQALALDYYATPETWGVAQALDRLLLAQNRWLQANGGWPTAADHRQRPGPARPAFYPGPCRRLPGLSLARTGSCSASAKITSGTNRACSMCSSARWAWISTWCWIFSTANCALDESFVLLSDGVWAVLGDTAIAAILRDQPDLDSAAQTLVNAAHLAGSQDNASALLVRVDALGEASIGDALIHLQQWPLPPALKPGQVFEGWQVEGVLGQSQQSLLYRVRDGQQQPWLLKTLPAHLHDDHQAGQALLSEEWFLQARGRAALS